MKKILHQLKTKPEFVIIFVAAIVFFSFLLPNQQQEKLTVKPPPITNLVLKALRDQNIDKRLEYAESRPIINDMTKYLRQFDVLIQTHPEKAKSPLNVIYRRLYYLKHKGLDVSDVEKILREQRAKFITQKS